MITLGDIKNKIEIQQLRALGIKEESFQEINTIYKDNALQGFLCFYEDDKNIFIENIFILKGSKNNGVGRETVQYLKNKYKCILKGESKPSAVGFWEKLGARFNRCINEELIAECEFEGVCIPFEIV